MKNLTKIFMAVMAGMLAFSCVTDITEDLGVNLGEGQTTISISLEESRTHLGEKVGEGEDAQYPLYWSEGDQIAVNGEVSNALPKSAHGKESATFTLNGAIGFPRTIVYPAPAEGVKEATADQYPVTFLATQEYKEGTFAEGAAPMYAYQASSDDAVALQHLSGVLSIAPYGEGVTLRKMTITAESGKLAGNFDVAADGTLTAHADASNTITVTFGEGLTLGATEADAKPIYVALPGGEFDMVSVKLYSESGMMSRSINTASKPITAGKVRVFPPLEFASNDEEGAFYIYDEASLRNFATNIASVKKAYLIADVDMTDKSWTSVSATNSFVLDGQNHMIKGLTAPMFNKLETNPIIIKNLHLNVNIDSNATQVGGLANNYSCDSKTADSEGLTNVTVSGNIKVGASTQHVGGIVAELKYATVYNIHNKANITVTGTHSSSILYIGGCVARMEGGNGSGPYAKMDYCKNSGTITLDKDCKVSKTCYIGGIFGVNSFYPGLPSNNIAGTNLENSGNIEIYGEITCDRFGIGGVLGYVQSDRRFSQLTNSGDVTVKSGAKLKNTNASKGSFIGGIVGTTYTNTLQFSDLTNTAEASITIEDGVEVNATSPYRIGGCVGIIGAKVNNLENNGAITIGAQIKDLYCGGVAGQVGAFAPTGYFTNNGAIEVSNTTTSQNLYVGGAAGWVLTANTNNLCNYGNIKVDATTENNNIIVGGVTAKSDKVFSNAKVFCDIEAPGYESVGMVMGTSRTDDIYTSNCAVGGSVQRGSADKENLSLDNYTTYAYSNEVDDALVVNSDKCGWLASKDAEPKYKFIAGLTISNADELQAFADQVKLDPAMTQNVELTANIDMSEVEWTPIEGYAGTFDGKEFEISGLKAPLFGATDASFKNLHLTNINMKYYKDVTYKVDGSNDYAVMGALVCHQSDANATIENCSASGTITINESSTILSYVGGLVGHSLSKQTFNGLVNNVNIDVSGTLSKSLYVAGCVAYTDGSLKSCKNLGNINIDLGANQSAAYTLAAAGVSTTCNDVTECTNGSDKKDELNKYGNITIRGDKLYRIHYCSGVACYSRNIYKCTNYGKLDIGGTITHSAGTFLIGGIFSHASNLKTVADCKNYGDIELLGNSNANGHIAGIGVITENIITLSDVYNYGNITYSATNSKAATYIGGILNTTSKTNLHNACNYGNVTVDGITATGLYLGGIVGRLNSVGESGKFSGNIINEGVIRMGKTANGKSAYVGGLFGGCNTAVHDITGDNIYSRGPIIVEEGATATNGIYIGGVIGSLAEATTHNPKIIGVKSACQIRAIGRSNVGMIIGTNRDTDNPKVKDCRVAGKFDTEYVFEDIVTNWWESITLDANNYQDYIYSKKAGETTDWAGAIRYDGNIFDSTLEHVEIQD